MVVSTTVDHYTTLGASATTASFAELKSNYRRLILTLHPDRNKGDVVQAQLLNEAWRVLGDPTRRQIYDKQLQVERASQQPVAGARPTIALIVDLSEFTPHCSTVDDSKESEQEPSHYTYPCRCSSTFVITTAELEQGVDIIQCGGCTERCRVEYQEVE